MATVTFDTLEYSNRLQKGGFTREQAEAMAETNSNAFGDMVNVRDLATKQDLAQARNELAIAIATTKSELEKKLAETKSELEKSIIETRAHMETALADNKTSILKWAFGMMIAQTTLILAGIGIAITLLK